MFEKPQEGAVTYDFEGESSLPPEKKEDDKKTLDSSDVETKNKEAWTDNKSENGDEEKLAKVRESLEQISPENEIKKVGWFPDLFDTFDKIKGLQGSQEYLPASYLKKCVIQVLEGHKELDSLTRTAGLREKVKELCKIWHGKRNDQQERVLDALRKNYYSTENKRG